MEKPIHIHLIQIFLHEYGIIFFLKSIYQAHLHLFEILLQQSTTSGTTFAIANTGANVASSVIVSIPSQTNYMTSGASSVSLGNLDAGDYTYGVEEGKYQAYFKEDIAEEMPVRVNYNNYDLTMGLDEMGYIDHNKQNYVAHSINPSVGVKNKNVISYLDILPNIDLEYEYGITQLKENIIKKLEKDTDVNCPYCNIKLKFEKINNIIFNFLKI